MNYIDSVLNYTGSKYKLLEQLLPNFDYNKKYFVDLFSGGGSVYINVLDKYEKILINDVIKDVINIHKEIMVSDIIIESTKKLTPLKGDKESFLKLREDYNNNPSADKLWALVLSSTNNMIRFNQKFKYNQTYGERGWSESTTKKVELMKNHIRKFKDKLKYTSCNFNDIHINKNCMVYIDPPYGYIKNIDGGIGKKQISEAGYNCFYKQQDDINLYNYIKNTNEIGASFVISGLLEHNGNKSWLLSKLIEDGFECKELNYNYNKVSRKGDKESKEVIVKNF
jgi:adenine-specific DNA-methyltransferase